MTHTFKSPKFHKELRMQYGPDKAISKQQEISSSSRSLRAQASSLKQVINETVPWNEVVEAQASSSKEPQASGSKLQAPSTLEQASSRKRQAP